MIAGICNKAWRSVSGFAKYQVSNIGRAHCEKTANVLKQLTDTRGYLGIELVRNSNQSVYKTHNLVANKLLEIPLNRPSTHIDRNPRNIATCFRVHPVNRASRFKEDSEE